MLFTLMRNTINQRKNNLDARKVTKDKTKIPIKENILPTDTQIMEIELQNSMDKVTKRKNIMKMRNIL